MEQQLPTNCPICDSNLKLSLYIEDDIYYHYANCISCHNHYHFGVEYSKSGEYISIFFKKETFLCGSYLVTNRYVINCNDVSYCEILCKPRNCKPEETKLNFTLNPQNLTQEKLESYLVLQ